MEQDNEKSIQSLIMEISRMYGEMLCEIKKGWHSSKADSHFGSSLQAGWLQPKRACAGVGCKPPTVTVSIQRLEKNGLLIRRQDEKDQRVSRIYLSDAGNAIIKEGMQMAREGEKQILSGFSESELCLMRRFCQQIKENIAAMPGPELSFDEMQQNNNERKTKHD